MYNLINLIFKISNYRYVCNKKNIKKLFYIMVNLHKKETRLNNVTDFSCGHWCAKVIKSHGPQISY